MENITNFYQEHAGYFLEEFQVNINHHGIIKKCKNFVTIMAKINKKKLSLYDEHVEISDLGYFETQSTALRIYLDYKTR